MSLNELNSSEILQSPDELKDAIAVVLVNWNGWKDTIAAFRSIEKSRFRNWKVIIVDNASTDESASKLKNLSENCILIESEKNLGFAGGCNIAAQRAMQLGISYLFFLNNDATIRQDTITHLLRASRELHDNAILGAIVRYHPSGEIQFVGSSRSSYSGSPEWRPTVESELTRHGDLIETDFVFGAALFVPTRVLKTVGLFDERYFLNFEETDWCYRATKRGHKCFVVKSSVVDHKGSSSIGGHESPLQIYFMQRNVLLFCESHCSNWQILRSYRGSAKNFFHDLSQVLNILNPRHDLAKLTFQARALAIRDYVLRRFGDCPETVRKLARDYSESTARYLAAGQES